MADLTGGDGATVATARIIIAFIVIALFGTACRQGAVVVNDAAPTQRGSTAAFQELLDATTEFQRELLEDGEVTFAELERAFLATVSCIEDKGIPVVVTELNEDGSSSIGMGGYQTDTELDEAGTDKVLADCEAEYLLHVQGFYVPPTAPTDPLDAAASQQIASCMAESGFEMRPVPFGWLEWQPALDTVGGEAVWMTFRACESHVLYGGPEP